MKERIMYTLAVDIGTTAVKAAAVDETGRRCAAASSNYPLITAQGGIVEQDARYWRELTYQTVRDCIKDLPPEEAACICLSTQGGSMVPVDAGGEALANAATWMDTRGAGLLRERTKGLDDRWFHERTGKALSPSGCLGMLLAFRGLNPAMYLTTLEYMHRQLTGQAVTDPTSAAMTGLYDIQKGGWQRELLALGGIDERSLASILPTGTVLGNLTREAADALGLTSKTLVVNGGHDQYCAAAGAGVLSPGDVLLSTGSAWVVFGAAAALNKASLLSAGPHVRPSMYGFFSSVPTGGVALDWVRGKLFGAAYAEFGELDEKTQARMGQNPSLMFRPHFSAERASVEGLSLHTDAYDIALAAMEGVVFEARRILEQFRQDGYTVKAIKLIGGASKASPWQRLVRAVIGEVRLFSDPNVAGAGAAALGGTAMGFWPTLEAASEALCASEMLPADTELAAFYEDKYHRYLKGGAFHGTV